MGITDFDKAKVRAYLSDITCGENCWNAREDVCRCECGGRNHGIHLRGENAVRACRINGLRYELIAVGTRRDLFKQAQDIVQAMDINDGIAWYEDGRLVQKYYSGQIGKYLPPQRLDSLRNLQLKIATMAQCLRWKELEYFQIATEQERYQKEPAILWQRKDITEGGR